MSNPVREQATRNRLLDRLPANEWEAIQPHLEQVALARSQLIQSFETEITHIHFPTTALVSLLIVLQETDPIECTTVGREGMFGIPVALGITQSQHKVICQMEGESLRLPVRRFQEAIEQGPVLARLVKHYIAHSLFSKSQSIACNSVHTVEQRACRWLLTTQDHAKRDEFPMTQEFLAFMLGVRRQSVTVVAGVLQNAGLIGYRRGVIFVRDRVGLEKASCECYASIKNYYDRMVL